MIATKLCNLLALASLAIFSVNALEDHHVGRRGHDSLAKRKRDSSSSTASKRCKARSSSVVPAAETTSVASSVAYVAASTSTSTSISTTVYSSSSSSSYTPTSTSSSAAVATTSASSSSSGSGKIGIAWALGDDSSLSNFKNDNVKYLYTWSPDMPDGAAEMGFTLMPMLWGYNQVSDFQSKVVAGYANIVLGMNEPNEEGQSNMSAEDGAALWQQYIQPLANEGYQLISPATSSNPNGKVWMQDFMAACSGCSFDGVAVHWYDVTADAFIAYVEDWHNTFNLPVWVTEYACENYNGGAQCSDDEVWSFMETTKSYMEQQDWIAAYFAFGVMHDMSGVNTANQLMASSGEPTDLGYYYINN